MPAVVLNAKAPRRCQDPAPACDFSPVSRGPFSPGSWSCSSAPRRSPRRHRRSGHSAQLVDLWTRQLDRIATRSEQANLLPAEIDALREQVTDVRAAASAAAALARNDLADTKKLLAPLEVKPGTDAVPVPESDAVKADRERLTEQATVSESRVKQCEVVIARADQLTERLTKLRGEVLLRHPAAPRCLPAVARGLEQAAVAIHDGGPDALGGDGGVGPRGSERAAFRRPGSRVSGRLGRGDHRAVGAGPLPAAPLRPRRCDRARPTRPYRRRRHRRCRPGAGADPRRLADRQAPGRDLAAAAHRHPAAGTHHPRDHLLAGDRAHRRGAVAPPAGLAGPALHQCQRAGSVDGPAPPDGGGPHGGLPLCRAGAQRRRARRPVGDRRPGTGHRGLPAHPAGAGQPRLALRAARGRRAIEDDRRHLVVDRPPGAERDRAVVHRLRAGGLRHPGRPSSQCDLHDLPLDRSRPPAASPGRRPARGSRRARHAAGQVAAPPPRPAARLDPARPAYPDAAVRRLARPAAGGRHSRGLERRHRRHRRGGGPVDPRRQGRRRHHLARQYRHGHPGLRASAW